MTCAGCGRSTALEDALCPSCGRFVAGDLSRDDEARRAARRGGGGKLIVGAIIIGAIAFVYAIAYGTYRKAQTAQRRRDAMDVIIDAHSAAESWRGRHAGCPTISLLRAEGGLPWTERLDDPWGRPYRIECATDETYVASDGPDRRSGTDDDLSVPARP